MGFARLLGRILHATQATQTRRTPSPLLTLVGRPLLFLDFETTGIDAIHDRAIEVAATRHDQQGRTLLHHLINPGIPVPHQVTRLTGISTEHLVQASTPFEVFSLLQSLLDDSPILVAHNALFDITILLHEQRRLGLRLWSGDFLCTRTIATLLGKGLPSVNRAGRPYISYKLSDVSKALGLSIQSAHRAIDDVRTTETIFEALYQLAITNNVRPPLNTVAHPTWAPKPDFLPSGTSLILTD